MKGWSYLDRWKLHDDCTSEALDGALWIKHEGWIGYYLVK